MRKPKLYVAFNTDSMTWDVMEDRTYRTVKKFETKAQAEKYLSLTT